MLDLAGRPNHLSLAGIAARLAEALPAWEVRPLQIDTQGAREENE